MNKSSGKLSRPDWISSSLWNEPLYKIWQVMRHTWQLFYRYDILHKIYFYLARQAGSWEVITGYTIYLPYSNKGAIIRLVYRDSNRVRCALEVAIDADKQVVNLCKRY